MNQYNFIVSIVDTDSATFGKTDSTPFSEIEIDKLNKELNSLYGEYIKWDFESSYKKIIAIRTKNYVLQEPSGKVTIKGSALKASTKSIKMKQFIKDIINGILEDKNDYEQIYLKYAKEICNITDIKDWCSRKTLTQAVLTGTRKNETNVLDAIQGTDLVEGDRFHTFYKDDGTLCLSERFNGDYSKDRLFLSLFDSMWIFSTILPMNNILNYKLKKSKEKLALL